MICHTGPNHWPQQKALLDMSRHLLLAYLRQSLHDLLLAGLVTSSVLQYSLQASQRTVSFMLPVVQEQAKAHSAEADTCRFAAHMIASDAMNQAVLRDQIAISHAAEADACQLAARMMVRSAFSKAVLEDQIATLRQARRTL